MSDEKQNKTKLEKDEGTDVEKHIRQIYELARAREESARRSTLARAAVQLMLEKVKSGLAINLGTALPGWVTFVGAPKKPGHFKLNSQARIVRRVVRMALKGESPGSIARIAESRGGLNCA